MFLHENMLNFFSDIGDVAKVLDVYSETDAICSDVTYSYANSQHILEM